MITGTRVLSGLPATVGILATAVAAAVLVLVPVAMILLERPALVSAEA